jgi:hypothetical protein
MSRGRLSEEGRLLYTGVGREEEADGRAREDEVQVSQVLRVDGSSGLVTILVA